MMSLKSKTYQYLLVYFVINLLVSLLMFTLAPRDTVDVWYPTALAYQGEAFLPFAALYLAMVVLCTRFTRLDLRRLAQVVAAFSLVSEIGSSLAVWFLLPRLGGERAWYSDFFDFLGWRLCLWLALAGLYWLSQYFFSRVAARSKSEVSES
jgi:hypothetical protein